MINDPLKKQSSIKECVDTDNGSVDVNGFGCNAYTGWVPLHIGIPGSPGGFPPGDGVWTEEDSYEIVSALYEWNALWQEPGNCCSISSDLNSYTEWSFDPFTWGATCSGPWTSLERECPHNTSDFNSADMCCACGGGNWLYNPSKMGDIGRCYDPNWWTITLLDYVNNNQEPWSPPTVSGWDPTIPGPWNSGEWDSDLDQYPGCHIGVTRRYCHSMSGFFWADDEWPEDCCCVPTGQLQNSQILWGVCSDIDNNDWPNNQIQCENAPYCQWLPGGVPEGGVPG